MQQRWSPVSASSAVLGQTQMCFRTSAFLRLLYGKSFFRSHRSLRTLVLELGKLVESLIKREQNDIGMSLA